MTNEFVSAILSVQTKEVFYLMKHVLTCNYKPKYSHSFSEGEYLIKVTGTNQVTSYIVEELISSEKIRVRVVNSDLTYSNVTQIISGKELELFSSNHVANELAKSIRLGA